MKKFFGSLMVMVLLQACLPPKQKENRPATELGPCVGANGFYEVRGDVVCHHGRVLSPNAADFVELGDGFAIDRKAGIIYSNASEIKGADVASFEILKGSYSRDMERVYYTHRQIKAADPTTFEFVGYAFAKDRSPVYNFGSIAPNIDASSFSKVEPLVATQEMSLYTFFKDKDNVYHTNSKLSESWNMGIDVDPATFAYYGGPFIQANRRVYFSFLEPLDANPDTFRFLGCSPFRIEDLTNHVFALDSPPRRMIFCYGQDGERVIEKEY
ncbi:MAG TPA: DKNYY domain-containing protein [Oligoflexus sp.]|uniref:DKNYY domain-containing protein n=1 Tax=Oligoflexus sp. TaxID=1971216 RepID=UPI002D2EAC00|nr:DKNYY domain-containing protein [Oligoflexus sp.]HYX34121.1 DKNYY domain-containing protein [Oligoflexus sp.]